MATPRTLYVDQHLSGVAYDVFNNNSYVADKIMPPLPSSKQTGQIFKRDAKLTHLTLHDTLRAASSPAKPFYSGDPATVPFNCLGHALKGLVSDEELSQAVAEALPFVANVTDVTNALLIRREVDCQALVNSTLVAAGRSTAVSTKWDNVTSGQMISDIKDKFSNIEDGIGKNPNAILLPSQILHQASQTTSWKDYVTPTLSPSDANQLGYAAILAALLGIPAQNVFLADSWYNSAAINATASMTRIWGASCVLFYVEPPQIQTSNFGQHVIYQNQAPNTGVGGFTVERWRDYECKAEAFTVNHYYDKLVANTNAAWQFTACLT